MKASSSRGAAGARAWVWLWLSMALAFAVYQSGGAVWRLRWPRDIVCADAPATLFLCAAFWEKLEVAGVQSVLALVCHEGGHALAARRYGAKLTAASASGWRVCAVVCAAGGVFLLGPTAQWAGPQTTRSQHANSAVAGVGASLVAAALWFAALSLIVVYSVPVAPWFPYLGYAGFRMNALAGLSALLPFAGFDGRHILQTRPFAYGMLVGAALILVFALGNEHVLQWLLQAVLAL